MSITNSAFLLATIATPINSAYSMYIKCIHIVFCAHGHVQLCGRV